MSSQIQITGETKVKSLTGVLVGTSGVVSSLNIDGSLGIPQLDVNGKIIVSQLPNSVMEYKGTWDASTNTPTLVNGTGNQGDVYLCSVAGTVNFGAGAISFVVSDQAIYSGSIWQKASGSNGTVTSVAVTETGDSLNITGSPITTSGTINIGFNGTNLQYINGAGDLTTFPSLTGYIPYTGATSSVSLGSYDITSRYNNNVGTTIQNNGSLGSTLFIQTGTGYGSSNLNGINFASGSTNNLTLSFVDGSANTKTAILNFGLLTTNTNRTYTLPNASGTVALTSDISYPVTSVFGRTGAVVATSGDYTTTLVTEGTNLYYTDTRARACLSFVAGSGAYNSTTGVITIPTNNTQITNGAAYITLASLSATSPIFYNSTTGVISSQAASATLEGYVTTSGQTLAGAKTFNNGLNLRAGYYSVPTVGDTGLASSGSGLSILLKSGATVYTNNLQFSNASNDYTFPNASGTIALVGGSGVGTVTSVAAITLGTSGTDLSSTVANSTTTPVITLNVPTASAANRGALSSADWTTFNSKQGTITLTTTGTSGAATFSSNTLNIPNYGSGAVTGTGTTNYHAKFTGTSTIGNSLIWDNGTNVGIGNTNTSYTLDVTGTGRFTGALSGTSATFSGANYIFTLNGGGSTRIAGTIANTSGGMDFGLEGAAGNQLFTGVSSYEGGIGTNNAKAFHIATNGTSRLSIASTGAATFSSSVTAGGTIKQTSAVTTTGATAEFYNASSAGYGMYIQAGTSANYSLLVTNYLGATAFQVLGSGAATFSSSVTATAADGAVGLKVIGGTGRFVIFPYFDATEGVLINSYNTAESGYKPMSFQASAFRFSQGAATFSSSVTANSHIYAVNGAISFGGSGSAPSTDPAIYRIGGLNDLAFAIGNTERMRITSGGATQITGQLSVTAANSSNVAVFNNGSSGYGLNINAGSGGQWNLYVANYAGTPNMYVTASGYGYLLGSAWAYGSDIRMKENISDVKNGLDMVLKMKPKHFDYINGQKDNLGFIAQDVQEIIPQAVSISDEKTGMLALKTDFLVPYLVKAIQELSKQNEELSNRLIKLESN
jgi:hypothetical protein